MSVVCAYLNAVRAIWQWFCEEERGFPGPASSATRWKDYKSIQDAIDIAKVELDRALNPALGGNPNLNVFTYTHPHGRVGSSWGIGIPGGDTSRLLRDYNNGFFIKFEKLDGQWKIITMFPN